MAVITLKIDGKKLLFFDSFSYSTQIDSVSSSISFNSFIDFETFGYINVEAYRDDVLIFTGEIISKTIPNSTPPQPYNYKAESLPHILFESTLPTTAYPTQLENSTLKDIVEYICSFFDVTVIFDQSAATEAGGTYKLADLGLGKIAGELINDLVTQVGLVLTHDALAQLIITKTIEQEEIILPRFTSDNKSFDLKKFFHNYIALGQAPIGQDADIQAIAVFDNIDTRRNITKIQDSGGIGTIEKKALGMRADSLKGIQQSLSFNNFFCNVGDFIFINDLKLIINQLDYSYNSSGESASISVIDSQIYIR
jgi:hypothetical protein